MKKNPACQFKKIISLMIIMVCAFSFFAKAQVTINGAGSYATISAAVTAASPGDIIEASPGVYIENVLLDKNNLVLRSSGGKAVTTIQGITVPGAGAVMVAGGINGVTIGQPGKGFTIIGFDGNGAIESGAVYLLGTHANITIEDNEIRADGDHGLLSNFNADIDGILIRGNMFTGQTFLGPNPGGCGFSTQFDPGNNVPRQLVTMGGGGGVTLSRNVYFLNNMVTGTAGGFNAEPGCAAFGQGNNLVTIDVIGCTISGNTFSGVTTRFSYSLRTRGPASSIYCNTFINTGLGVACGNIFFGGPAPLVGASPSTLAGVATANAFPAGGAYLTPNHPASYVIYRDMAQATAVAVSLGAGQAAVAAVTVLNCPVLNVNTGMTFQTIQSAINNPLTLNGHTLIASAGTYNENVTVNKGLILKGANASVSPCTGSRGAESTVMGSFALAANGISIDGFEFTGTGARIFSSGGGSTWSNISIQNNWLHATTAQIPIQHGLGSGGGIGTSNWNVSNNKIDDIQSSNSTAIVLFNIDDAVASNNCISHTNALFIGRRGINADGLQNANINGNSIDMGDINPTTQTNAVWGIQVSMSDRDATGITIDGNLVSNVYRAVVVLSQRNLTGLAVQNNEFGPVVGGIDCNTGSTIPQIPQPVQSNIIIKNNKVTTVTTTIPAALGAAVRLRNLHSATANGPVTFNNVQINENSFIVTAAAIIYETGTGISNENATCNWYGTTNNAVIATKISGPVTYVPYLTNGTDNSAATGFQPVPGSCNGSNVLTITCPADISVQCTSEVPVANVGSVTTSGTCPGIVVTHMGDVISNQTCANRYTITRTYQATDACSNTATCSQTITVYDNTPPTITCPPNQTVIPTTLAGTVVTYPIPSVSDNCSGVSAPVRTAGPASGSIFPIGTTTVTYQVTDACGNTATCSFTITVIDYCDNKQKKVNVCHNGKTLCVSINAVQSHLDHGDYLGPCTTSLQSIVDVEPVTDEFRVVVSPNPSSSNFSLKVISRSNAPISVKIMDLSGKVMTVNSTVVKGSITNVGNELRAGTYIAEVIQGENRQVIRLVKVN